MALFHFRVQLLQSIANYFQLNLQPYNITELLFIHADNLDVMRGMFKIIFRQNLSISKKDLQNYFRVVYSLARSDIVQCIECLAAYDYLIISSSEKILKSKELLYLLAVDGFLGYTVPDLKKYACNLKTGNLCVTLADKHIHTVRNIYHLACLKALSGTDSAAVIFASLLNVYIKYVKSSKILIRHQKNVQYYLLRQSKIYSDIQKTCLDAVICFYESNMTDLSFVAQEKILQLSPL